MPSRVRRRLLHVASADWGPVQVRNALRAEAPRDAVERLEAEASEILGVEVVAFGSGRAALAALLLATERPPRRVVVPAFTCVAVPNAVETARCEARFVDVADVNLDPLLAAEAAEPGDAVIVQHTYGIPVPAGVTSRLRERGLFVIEDRAHRFDGRDIFGDAGFYSLEHSKVISAGAGGLAWARDDKTRERLRRFRDQLPPAPSGAIRRTLRTSAVQAGLAALPAGMDHLGSLLRRTALHVPALSAPSQSPDELSGGPVELLAMHPAAAAVARVGLRFLSANLDHRRRIGEVYKRELGSLVPEWARDDLPLVRQPVLVDDADEFTRRLLRCGVDLGRRWFDAPIHPRGSRTLAVSAAPRAKALAATVLSLPTHPRIEPDTARFISTTVGALAREDRVRS